MPYATVNTASCSAVPTLYPEAGMRDPFTMTGRLNCGLSLADRKT